MNNGWDPQHSPMTAWETRLQGVPALASLVDTSALQKTLTATPEMRFQSIDGYTRTCTLQKLWEEKKLEKNPQPLLVRVVFAEFLTAAQALLLSKGEQALAHHLAEDNIFTVLERTFAAVKEVIKQKQRASQSSAMEESEAVAQVSNPNAADVPLIGNSSSQQASQSTTQSASPPPLPEKPRKGWPPKLLSAEEVKGVATTLMVRLKFFLKTRLTIFCFPTGGVWTKLHLRLGAPLHRPQGLG